MSDDAVHARLTEEHDGAVVEVIVGTAGAVPSAGAQFTVIETTFESRVTDVNASIANCHDEPFAAPTDAVRTFPKYPPADHAFALPPTTFDITRYVPVADGAVSVHDKLTRGDVPHVTVGTANTNDDAGERNRCANAGTAALTMSSAAQHTIAKGAVIRRTSHEVPPSSLGTGASCLSVLPRCRGKSPTPICWTLQHK